jgi:hypothetical protein
VARAKTLLSLSDLDSGTHYSDGIRSKVYISRLMLELNQIIKTLAKGNLHQYHTHEDSLYEPLKEVLTANLPHVNVVTIKNAYPKMSPRKETDISIRKICQVEKSRDASDLDCTHYIEIKSIFHNETLSSKNVDDDLEKLFESVKLYGSSGIFVLVGLKNDLNRRKRSLSNLGKLGEDEDPFMIKTYNGDTIWLNPVGSHNSDDPYVFVWEVSPENNFEESKSSCEYSIFQRI